MMAQWRECGELVLWSNKSATSFIVDPINTNWFFFLRKHVEMISRFWWESRARKTLITKLHSRKSNSWAAACALGMRFEISLCDVYTHGSLADRGGKTLFPYLNGPWTATKTANRANIKMLRKITRGKFQRKFRRKERWWKFLWKTVCTWRSLKAKTIIQTMEFPSRKDTSVMNPFQPSSSNWKRFTPSGLLFKIIHLEIRFSEIENKFQAKCFPIKRLRNVAKSIVKIL